MKNAIKGALLSGLVLPGLGQVFFRRYLRGVVLMVTVCASLSVMAALILEKAVPILEKIEAMVGRINGRFSGKGNVVGTPHVGRHPVISETRNTGARNVPYGHHHVLDLSVPLRSPQHDLVIEIRGHILQILGYGCGG